ncbi:MAG TPA: hypothetical protein VFK94_03295 [Patescibacteria group bacterium]|nr:hypothetical protein [Patescibacteria group bacterium]
MDAQGHERVRNVGVIAPINLNDCFSHARLLCYPCQVGNEQCERQPTMEDYQLALRLAFTQWGLPCQLQVDHAAPFFDNHTTSPYPTRLHQWLLALDIELLFSQRATDQGLTERSHQLWHQQCLEQTAPFADWMHLYTTLLSRRDHLNHALPCRTTDHLPPLVACPAAHHSGRFYHPQHEASLLDLHRLEAFLARNHWFRRLSRDGAFSLGAEVYYVGKAYAHQQIEITFDPADTCFHTFAADGSLLKTLPPRNFSCETLMGQFAQLFNLPLFQFQLPLDGHSLQAVRLCDTLAV